MKRLIYLLLSVFLLSACGTNKRMTNEVNSALLKYDSIVASVLKSEIYKSQVEKNKQSVIDSMRNVKLPVEQSVAIVPDTMRSHLYTSLAYSDAWIDANGLLNHTIQNKDSAMLPQRTITNDTQKETKETATTDKDHSSNVSSASDKESAKSETTIVEKNRFMEGFFYASGWVLWLGIVAYVVYWLQSKTTVKPITRLFSFIKKLIKK